MADDDDNKPYVPNEHTVAVSRDAWRALNRGESVSVAGATSTLRLEYGGLGMATAESKSDPLHDGPLALRCIDVFDLPEPDCLVFGRVYDAGPDVKSLHTVWVTNEFGRRAGYNRNRFEVVVVTSEAVSTGWNIFEHPKRWEKLETTSDNSEVCDGRFVPLPDGRTFDTHGLSNAGEMFKFRVKVPDELLAGARRRVPTTVTIRNPGVDSAPAGALDAADQAEVTARVGKRFVEDLSAMLAQANEEMVAVADPDAPYALTRQAIADDMTRLVSVNVNGGLTPADWRFAASLCEIDTAQGDQVTKEKIATGEAMLRRLTACLVTDGGEVANHIYRAMHAAAPVPLVSEAIEGSGHTVEWHLARACQERDSAIHDYRLSRADVLKLAGERDEAAAENAHLRATLAQDDSHQLRAALWEADQSLIRAKELLTTKDARIAGLAVQRDKLQAQNDAFQATFAAMSDQLAARENRIAELDSDLTKRPAAFTDPAHADSKPTPFRAFPNDPRRMGPVLPEMK